MSGLEGVGDSGARAIERTLEAEALEWRWADEDAARAAAWVLKQLSKASGDESNTSAGGSDDTGAVEGVVALQFPDELLAAGGDACAALQRHLPPAVRAVVLGDTSYGACCVDEVNADHAAAKVVIHFGSSCLSPPSRLPTLLVFQQAPIDVAACAEALSAAMGDVAGKTLVVLRACEYEHASGALCEALRGVGAAHVVEPAMPSELLPLDATDKTTDGAAAEGEERAITCCGQRFTLPEGASLGDEGVAFVYVGGAGPRLTNLLLRRPTTPCWSVDPKTTTVKLQSSASREVNRRFFLVQRASTAATFGIVVGTLAVARYREVLAAVRALIRSAGRQCYTLVVGKVNPAKLGNFADVCEAFVLVSCPESGMFSLDTSEYFAPILSPFELAVALSAHCEWSGEIKSDFGELLPALVGDDADLAAAAAAVGDAVAALPSDGDGDGDASDDDDDDDDDEDAPVFSTASGGYVWRPSRPVATAEADEGTAGGAGAGTTVSLRGDTRLAVAPQSAAADVLAAREYRGLDPRVGETAVEDAREGLSGIAASYASETTGKGT